MPTYGTFVKNFVDDLRKRNAGGSVDVCTICGRRSGKPAKIKAYASFYARLTIALLKSRHDLIYIHTVNFPAPAVRLASLFRKNLPLVFNVHGDDVLPSNRLKKMLKQLSKPAVRRARMVVCPSRYFKEVVEREFKGIDSDRLFVSPSGGLHRRFYLPKTGNVVTGDIPVIGYVSRIDPGKGWQLFIEMIARLNREGIKCRGVMAGRGSESGLVKEYIDRHGAGDKIDYIGPQPQEALPALYHSFNLFVFPTFNASESLGLVGLEAMAAGTPVVASDMAGPKGYIENGINGYRFTPRDLDSLCQAVKSYLALDDDRKKAMSDNAYNCTLDYRAEEVGERLWRRICSVVEEKAAR